MITLLAQDLPVVAPWFEAWRDTGAASVIIIFFICVSLFVVWRLFGKEGILTKVGSRHIEYVAKTEELQVVQTGIMDKLSAKVSEVNQDTKHLLVEHYDPNSVFSTTKLTACAGHACDLLDLVCRELKIEDHAGPIIANMRRELHSVQPVQTPIPTKRPEDG